MEIEKAVELLDNELSIITIGDGKKPTIKWEGCKTTPLTGYELTTASNNRSVKCYGMVTGYGDVEVLDVDLKVFNDANVKKEFWDELIYRLSSSLDAFWERFVIYRTQNMGYHIIYRYKGLNDGNKGLAKLLGHDRCVIETRGVGGYAIMYDDKITENGYENIQYVTYEERELIMEIAKSYQGQEFPRIKVVEEVITPWADYNKKNDIVDLLLDEFDVIDEKADRYIVRRFGAESDHSGYVYKDSNCLYLFSTGTRYPAEKLLSPFSIYAEKYNGGDHKAAARDLYAQGYGSRMRELPYKERIDINADDLQFPLDILPTFFADYIKACNHTLGNSIDYMGVSFIWMTSLMLGNYLKIKVKEGWVDAPIVWISIVGRAGVGKTPSIISIIKPLLDLNANRIKDYKEKYHAFKEYEKLDKQEKKGADKVTEPIRSQFIVNDITLESLVELHEDNPNAVGVFKDELAGWYKDMNKYRAGSDMEFWLSSWSGRGVSMNRKSAKSSFVEEPMIPVVGGIQPGILEQFYTDDNMENGFVDRMLICYPDVEVESYCEDEMEYEYTKLYNDMIKDMHYFVQLRMVVKNEVAVFDVDAKKEWAKIFDELTALQNDEGQNEYVRNMLAKQKTYIPRFALMINFLDFCNEETDSYKVVRMVAVQKAYRLSKYFIAMSKKVRIESQEKNIIKEVANRKGMTAKDKMRELYRLDKKVNKSECAKVLKVSRQTINNWIKEFEK